MKILFGGKQVKSLKDMRFLLGVLSCRGLLFVSFRFKGFFYDYSIWINCSESQALKRAIKRDGEDSAEIWKKVHAPNERDYALLQEPMKHVDLLVNNEKSGFLIAEFK